MKYIELFGNDIQNDIVEIKKDIDADASVVFVYSGAENLYDYINALYDKGKGLDAEYLYKFKVCYEKKDLQVTYSAHGGKSKGTITTMGNLVNVLDGETPCKIVVENDEREQLAFIVQQLIFIEYPLEIIDILLRKEEKDADKTNRFMKNVDELRAGCIDAITRLDTLKRKVAAEMDDDNPTKSDRLKDIDDALDSCNSIKTQIDKSLDVELKFAVAASKKAGKSVIVNCFLGEQIAPTSTELATPNNCIYKKSPDGQYHLQLEGNVAQEFATREEIYDVIDNHFRAAQNNKEKGFALPDMNIGYVSEENNFSSYTIYDTAGPDAAGTTHADVADKAMQKCDVAVFAIDYSKYLTTSEEDYLRRVKEMFTAQNKFHSLIFALNKIDVRYTDTDSPKSFVSSVDFLKTRLANIDDAYRDCIIFPTCSLEYFSALEAEKAGIVELAADKQLPIGEMKRLKFTHKDVPALAWLHAHSDNLEYYHGIETISYDVFKKDSGMPALMNYVSYVAKSKARDEIVNNVTFEISAQKTKIQSVLDFVANIEALINADDEKIEKISDIINSYTNVVQDILSSKFRDEELNALGNSLLKRFNGDYDALIAHQRLAVEDSCQEEDIINKMYDQMTRIIWEKIRPNDKCVELDGHQIDNLFSTDDFRSIAQKIDSDEVGSAAGKTYEQLSTLKKEVTTIAASRQRKLLQASDNCREQLAKEHIAIELPKLPEFSFAAKMTSPSNDIKIGDINLKLFDGLSEIFKKSFFGNVGTFFSNVFGSGTDKDYKRSYKGTRPDFIKKCNDELRDSFENALRKNRIADKLRKKLTQSVIDQYMNDLVKELKEVFKNMNDTYMSCIERFRSAIDDRDKYKADIQSHNFRKDNILAIADCTKAFMEVWEVIIRDIVEEEAGEDAASI